MTSVSSSNSTELGYRVSALQPAEPTATTVHPLAMSEATGAIAWQTPSDSKPPDNDASLSYTHRDRQAPPGSRWRLHQIGRRFGLRAVKAFRDDTNLAVNPDLWGTTPKNPATRRAVPTRRAVRSMSAMLSALAISLLACSTPPAKVSQSRENTPLARVSYATTAQVLEAVKAAEQVQTLPDTVAPPLQQDDGGGASGCFDRLDAPKPAVLETHQLAGDMTFGECASGDQDGTKLMVIFGDSRAWMFSAPLELIAAKTGWKLRVFEFDGCELGNLEYWSNETNAPNKDCDAFRSAAISQIRALHPNLVITTSAGDHKLADGTMPTPAQLQGAWMSTFQKLAQPGTRLAMIGPIPVWPNDGARCLAAHVRKVQACSIATAEVVTNEYEAPQASAAAAAGVVFVSPRPWVCADRCEPVIADIRVYRETYHFSKTYAVYLTGALSEALQPAMT
jgi:SGNH domain (fused to AT3 domains)